MKLSTKNATGLLFKIKLTKRKKYIEKISNKCQDSPILVHSI